MRFMRRCLVVLPMICGGFTWNPPGVLLPGSGTGQPSSEVEVADMRFPIEEAPAYLNSQVYNLGGSVLGGSQCDAGNYAYPWYDNFCESRTHTVSMCPTGRGHQGQDIRPSTCQDNTHWVVATENGTITQIATYTVSLQGVSGVRHRFLHMQMSALAVYEGQYVTKGQRLGRVSNDYGGAATTIHLHYDMNKPVAGLGNVYVSPYLSLVNSYQLLLGLTPTETPNAGTCPQAPVAGAEQERFLDVPPTVSGAEHIEAIANAGITTGCAPDLFCPECPTERYMMAVFVARAAGLDITNPPATPSFTDVPASAWYYPYVEAVKAAGIVSGCSATTFCPTDWVTRKETAKFMALGASLPLVTPATPTFTDVPASDWSYPYVETLAEHCVTVGCAPDQYCPNDIVSRRVAAIFLARSFDLEDLNTCLDRCDVATCDGGSFCEDWGSCGGFSSTCDETGTETRVCHDFACSGSLTQGSCDATTRVEARGCSRETDGQVIEDWSAWDACDVADPDCGGDGVRQRGRSVCASGAVVSETESQSCSLEPTVDADGDGICDANDLCLGDDATGDVDLDGVCGDLDACAGDDATGDADLDGICDDQDLCTGDDVTGDSDTDGVCDDRDLCEGNDALDADVDGVPDACDLCAGTDATGDSDGDGVCDDLDVCDGDDTLDEDLDGVPDACDVCFGDDTRPDFDADGLCEPELTATPVIAGDGVVLEVSGAPAGATVVFARSKQPPGNACVWRRRLCLDLAQPSVLGTSVVSPDGEASLEFKVPAGVPVGATVRFQAVWRLGDRAEVSNVVAREILAGP